MGKNIRVKISPKLMFHFYNPWKHPKTGGFLTFSRGTKYRPKNGLKTGKRCVFTVHFEQTSACQKDPYQI